MMNFLKKSYRQRAIQEGKGNYTQAAAFYSKAEEFEKVGEMHELLGDFADTFPAKIRAYQQALRWYRQPDHQEPLAYKLAEIMEADIRADATVSAIESRRLPMVAEYYALAKKWKKAGICSRAWMYEESHRNVHSRGKWNMWNRFPCAKMTAFSELIRRSSFMTRLKQRIGADNAIKPIIY
jgi:hypothetical protein